jgi:hypothetical protein
MSSSSLLRKSHLAGVMCDVFAFFSEVHIYAFVSNSVVRSCRKILWSDSVVRFCLLKLFKYFYRAVCKKNTRTCVGD